jgi:hypothetical protein
MMSTLITLQRTAIVLDGQGKETDHFFLFVAVFCLALLVCDPLEPNVCELR